jgi:two-component system OmpR family response regulator
LLVVEDDPDIAMALRLLLTRAGHEVAHAKDGRTGLKDAYTGRPELVILDIGLPGLDGWQVLERLRDVSDVPVLLLTAHGQESDKVRGLRGGADDYLTKPFNPRELLARIKAVLRRVNSLPPRRGLIKAKAVRFDRWILNIGRRELVGQDRVAIPLSTAEFRLLSAFLEHAGLVLSRDQLLDLTVGKAAETFDRSIDNQVSRLRRKIELDPKAPALIKTHWGGGYSFTAEVEPL